MIRLRATVRPKEDDRDEVEEERRLWGVSVPGLPGTDSTCGSSFLSKHINCTSPVSRQDR